MKDKCCGNCKYFKNEDLCGWGICAGFLEKFGVHCSHVGCLSHLTTERIVNGWTEITPDNVDEIKSVEGNRVIICASNSIGYMYPSTLLSLACSLESIADYGGYYYYVLPELKIE
jgi:hypothetical protein